MPKQSRKPKNPSVENKPKTPDNIANLGANGLLSDGEIIELVNSGKLGIDPFILDWRDDWEGEGKPISYGLTSAGYDVRLKNPRVCLTGSETLDPKNEPERCFAPAKVEHNRVEIPPHGFLLAESVESFSLPANIKGICYGKSTYARIGIIANITPLEPLWGPKNPGEPNTITLEFSNTTNRKVIMYLNEGCVQVEFHKITPVRKGYSDRGGRYMGQDGVTLPKGFKE